MRILPSIAVASLWGTLALAADGGAVLFSLSQWREGTYALQPVLTIRGNRFYEPPVEQSGAGCREFPARYMNAGQSYAVLFGGERVGTVSLGPKSAVAVSFRRPIRLVPGPYIKRPGMGDVALATNSKSLGRAGGSRRPPTPEERSAAIRLAQEQFRRNGVPAALRKKMAVSQLTSTDVNGDGRQDLIGVFVIAEDEVDDQRRSLFLIAEGSVDSYVVSHAKYHQGLVGQEDFEQFIDHLDLNGDGADEIVTQDIGYEWYTFHVYARRGGRWVRIYTGYGCKGV